MERQPNLKTALAILLFNLGFGSLVVSSASLNLNAAAPPAPPSPILGPVPFPIAGVDAGEILLGELNCLACHTAAVGIKARLSPRQAPVLGANGTAITPQYLRAFLADPQTEKPGSTMPDLLHAMDASTKSETVEALVHYLMSIRSTNASAPTGADQVKMQQGQLLFHQIGCVACHAPQEPASTLRSKPDAEAAPPHADRSGDTLALQTSSIPLGHLAKKMTVEALKKFLMDPVKVRPSGRMPSFSLSENEATALAIYLLREQAPGMYDPAAPLQKIKGLKYEYFEARFSGDTPNFEALRPRSSGFVDGFSLGPRRRNNNMGFRFTGLINIPSEGDYTFFSESDDGSRVYIGNELVVKNDGQHAMTEAQGKIHLKSGEHPIMVTYFNGGAEWGLKVSFQGPGVAKQEIPTAALSHLGQPMIPIGGEKFAVDVAKADKGKELFSALGCAACHQVSETAVASRINAKPLAALNAQEIGGCLGDRVRNGVPQFHLSDAQRQALKTVLANQSKLSQTLDAKTEVARTLTALNCLACHSRDGVGGPNPMRAEYFTTVGDADLGDEGRIPPHLSGVGTKLRRDWIQEVLFNKGTVRPYMATRMPQFGKSNIEHLMSAFEKADGAGPAETTPENSARLAKFGHKLVGREGLTCIACHTFAQFKSLGVPAMDMTQMAKRLKKDWFRRYLLDPASLRPGTRMPTFWPEGVAANKDILGGNTAQQIEAIWAFLSKGREADVPDGLIQAKMEIVVGNEAIIYRNFIEGAGARGIAVGYPEKANLAFDAANLRLAMIWQGAFIDASRHRSDRGAGNTPPLGNNMFRMPPGAPFAVLDDAQTAWPNAVGKKADYQMHGYRLDQKRRPTFLYSFKDIQIEDYPVAAAGEIDPTFTRTLTLHSGRAIQNLWFRAAAASKIEAKTDGEFLVDGKLSLKFKIQGGAKPLIRQNGGQSELLVPVQFQGNEARLVEEIIW